MPARLAGLFQFGQPFRSQQKDSPPPAAHAKDFRAQARPQRSFTAPHVRPPLEITKGRSLPEHTKGGRTMGGCEGRLSSTLRLRPEGRSGPEPDTPSHWPPKAATVHTA